ICLPIDSSMRLFDCILTLGLEFLISFSIAFVKQYEQELLKLQDSFDVIEYFRNLFTVNNKDNLNTEEIISNARKLDIPKQKIQTILSEYEKINNVHLS